MKQLIILYIQKCQPLTLDKNCILFRLTWTSGGSRRWAGASATSWFQSQKNFAEDQEN